MAMSLDEMLALLPDNTSGEIGADDLRTIVTELFTAAHTFGDRVTYGWVPGDPSPAVGKVYLNNGWSTTSTLMALAEQSADGIVFTFAAVDRGDVMHMAMTTPAGGVLRLSTNGPSVDNGTYRNVPVIVTSATGAAPLVNDSLSVEVATVMT